MLDNDFKSDHNNTSSNGDGKKKGLFPLLVPANSHAVKQKQIVAQQPS